MKKINIVFIVHQLNCGGMESALFNLVNLMNNEKFDITIFTVMNWGVWEEKFRNAGIEVVNQYSRLRKRKNIIGKIFNFFALKYIERTKEKKIYKLLSLATKKTFDIVVSYQVFSPYEKVGFPGYGKTIKYVHGNVKTNTEYFMIQKKMMEANNYYDQVICVSEDSLKAFIELTGRKNKICTVFNPIDGKKIIELASENNGFFCDSPYICAVGRLSPEKGFFRLIGVFKRLLSNGCKFKLIIIGDGKERNKIETEIHNYKADKDILLLGQKENPYPYIKNSMFTVLPSFTEGLSVVAMESICLGVPIVSSYPSTGEIFGSEECGIITNIDDQSLYNGMYKMITDVDFYSKAKQGAIRRSKFFEEGFMVKQAEQIFLDLYNEGDNNAVN